MQSRQRESEGISNQLLIIKINCDLRKYMLDRPTEQMEMSYELHSALYDSKQLPWTCMLYGDMATKIKYKFIFCRPSHKMELNNEGTLFS